MFSSKRKRKNDDPPPFPAWIMVVIAIGLVIAAVVLFESQPVGSVSNSATYSFPADDAIQLTATYIVKQATAMAQGTPQPGIASSNDDSLDPMLITATYIIKQATALAQGTPQPGFVINSP